ncbi:glycosyltransferase family 2 protein [Hirschia litorea]|uniref:Glycosyltransferase family 2 protein n=1 Tax=Hirschia litorea TaxID=1199156 RepID=A0ABW2IG74_9PROT
MEKTSVILPTFNREDFLVEALESLLGQTLPPAEILVMDDGSTDNTYQRMQAYSDKIRYIKKSNTGKADTLNQALKLVQNPLVWIMDDDDIALPNALLDMTKLLDGKLDTGIAYGRYNRFHLDAKTGERIIQDGGYWAECDGETFFQTTLQDFFVHHPGMLVRKSAYEAAGNFSLEYPRLEDYEMLVRLAQVTKSERTESTIFLQRQHDGDRVDGLAADKRFDRWISEEKQFFTKLYSSLPLSAYSTSNSSQKVTPPSLEREALIQRGVVMARKKLWNLALQDLERASYIHDSPNDNLSDLETNALRQILFSKYGSEEFLSDQTILPHLKKIRKIGPIGRAITNTIGRGQLWFIRSSLQSGKLTTSYRHLVNMTSLWLTR